MASNYNIQLVGVAPMYTRYANHEHFALKIGQLKFLGVRKIAIKYWREDKQFYEYQYTIDLSDNFEDGEC